MKSVLNNDIKNQPKEDILLTPNDFNYENSKWDGKLIAHHLKEKYNIDLKVRRCQYLLKELGFSPAETEASS